MAGSRRVAPASSASKGTTLLPVQPHETKTPRNEFPGGFHTFFKQKGIRRNATINHTLRVLSRSEKEDTPYHAYTPALSRRSDTLAPSRSAYPTAGTRPARGHCALPLHRRPAAAGRQWRERPAGAQEYGGYPGRSAGADQAAPGVTHAECR